MDDKLILKITYIVNTWLFAFVIIMMLLFKKQHIDYMVYFSIPTIFVYIINYALIYKRKLTAFLWLVYFWIGVYMGITNICTGYSAGYHLYAMSLIPIAFYSEYMAYKLQMRKAGAVCMSIILIGIYIFSSLWSIYHGAIYHLEPMAQSAMLIINALIVFSFIIFYSHIVIKTIINSEEKLKSMALKDELTGLYNRYYMIEQINKQMEQGGDDSWLAMIDIDNFKKINDTYGHNAGDYVLMHFSEILKEICSSCVVSRWGGEEYLIMASSSEVDSVLMEKLRSTVFESKFVYQDVKIPVSITIGVADYENTMTLDSWIQKADSKLYYGKNNGKNVVIW